MSSAPAETPARRPKRASALGLDDVVKDARAIGDDRVLAHAHGSAQGRASGAAVEGDVYHCCWLRHGRFIRVEDHLTLQGALQALGLSGETLKAAGVGA